MANLTMFDATSPGRMPVDPASVGTQAKALAANVALAAYCDRGFASDWIGCVNRYPELAKLQRIVSIASTVSTTARILDYEKGNPCFGDPDAAALWVLKMLAHGVYKPGLYADQSDMPALQAAYVRHKVPRLKVSLWLAAPGSDPRPFEAKGFDLVQDKFGDAFDVSDVKPEFFPPVDPPKPTPAPKPATGQWAFAGTYDPKRNHFAITGTAGQNVHMAQRNTTAKFTGAVNLHTGAWSIRRAGLLAKLAALTGR